MTQQDVTEIDKEIIREILGGRDPQRFGLQALDAARSKKLIEWCSRQGFIFFSVTEAGALAVTPS